MAADPRFTLIAITPPKPLDNEADRITALLDSGSFDLVHLRHPDATPGDMAAIISGIPSRLHSRLRLHSHFELAGEFGIGGLHLNRHCPHAPQWYRGPVSRSCHSVDEIMACGHGYDFVTLSPVFDSLSKPGYRAAFNDIELRRLDDIAATRVIALGGVTPSRLPLLTRYNFAGAAMLSAAWQPIP